MIQRAPAFQFYPRQFSGDDHVMAMDLDVVGAHTLLMCAAAASPEGHRIPADERAIRTRLRNPSDGVWQRIKSQLLSGAWKISEDGQWWEQHGLRRTLEKQREFSAKQSQRAEERWKIKNHAGTMPDPCRTDADQSLQQMPKGCSSSSSSSSTSQRNISEVPSSADSLPDNLNEAAKPALRLALLLKARMLENNPKAIITDVQVRNWEVEADRMIRLDRRTEQEISELILWSQNDPFWLKNILSMAKLRTKFDQLTLQSQHREYGFKDSSHEVQPQEYPLTKPRWTGLDSGIERRGQQ